MGFIEKFKKGFKYGFENRKSNKELNTEKHNYDKKSSKDDGTKSIENLEG